MWLWNNMDITNEKCKQSLNLGEIERHTSKVISDLTWL